MGECVRRKYMICAFEYHGDRDIEYGILLPVRLRLFGKSGEGRGGDRPLLLFLTIIWMAMATMTPTKPATYLRV